eukprot:GHVS01045298.1.p1 GENE.GHVS01045298.1~~GHVS01045298.1.p1  ORF type:complete len:152 (+),score=26.04 GHVS01045298.1:845-1300(+)
MTKAVPLLRIPPSQDHSEQLKRAEVVEAALKRQKDKRDAERGQVAEVVTQEKERKRGREEEEEGQEGQKEETGLTHVHITITGVGGEEPVHALLDLPTAVGGAMSTEVFYVINHPGVIIGMPWLQKAQAVLFMASGLLKFEDGTPSVQCPR